MYKKLGICLLFLIFLIGCSNGPEEKGMEFPEFPWPPPKASAFANIPTEFLTKPNEMVYLKDVVKQLESALEKAGYYERKLYSVKDGFSIATRIEQIRFDGTSMDEEIRWEINTPLLRNFSFKNYLKALFTSNSTHYRMIVFIVTLGQLNERQEPLTPNETKAWFSRRIRSGGAEEIENSLFTRNHSCTALIYEFEKLDRGHEPIFIETSRLQGKTHLERAKLLGALENPL